MKANYLKGLSHVLNHLPRPVLVTELPTVRAVPSRGTVVVPRLQGRELLMPPVSSPLQLLSLLLEALSCSDRVVQLSTLSCLQPLLLEAPQIMSLHVDTLVTKFLSLTSSPAMVRAPLSCTVLPGPAPRSCAPLPSLPSPLCVAGCPHRRPALRPRAHQPAHHRGKCSCCLPLLAGGSRGAHSTPALSLRAVSVLQLLPYKARVIRALAKPLDDKKRLVRKEAVAARGEW